MKAIYQPSEKQALAELISLDCDTKRERYSNVPAAYIPQSKFESVTSNGLTECVLKWLTLKGHYTSRIQSQGQFNEKLGVWTKSTVRRGIGDVMAIIGGRSIMIEIKVGRDRQSDHQKRTESEVTESGGLYLIVRSFSDFLTWYESYRVGSSPVETR